MFGARDVTVAGSLEDLDEALAVAAPIASAGRARLRVLVPPGSSRPSIEEVSARIERHGAAATRIHVIPVELGSPDAFLAAVARAPCDLLVKVAAAPTHGWFRGRGALDRRLLHETACAVLLARRLPGRQIRRVAAAVRTPDPWTGALSDRDVLDAAELLARVNGAQLHVIHGWTAFTHRAIASDCSLRGSARARRAEREHVRSELTARLCQAGMLIHPRRVHAILGFPEDVLVTAPARLRIDTLVVGGPRHPGSVLSRLFSAADHVLQSSECSVMVVSRGSRRAGRVLRLIDGGGAGAGFDGERRSHVE